VRSFGFALVDVFTDEALGGNPLPLIVDARGLAEAEMRRIAAEFNHSETTFLLPPTDSRADRRLRSFTRSGAEFFGAGHNALGAWWWLAQSGTIAAAGPSATFRQEIGEHVLPVEVRSDAAGPRAIGMTQSPPSFGATQTDLAPLAAALRLEPAELALRGLPAQVVSTGAAHLLVPVRDRAALERARPDAAPLAALLRAAGAQGCYLFCLDPLDPAATGQARFFNPGAGNLEDPATGSAAGPLACHLREHGVVPAGGTAIFEQGHAMGRPSRIEVSLAGDAVLVLGRAVVVAEGTLRL
jgi:PhzF family phenazine biosynthesis protein